jgi:hypothetical protein
MPALLRDLRYAARILRQNPVFACVAIVTITLGIGSTTAIFSVLDAVLVLLTGAGAAIRELMAAPECTARIPAGERGDRLDCASGHSAQHRPTDARVLR